ncbi:MAG: hypothetical protein PHV80_08360, partial [Rugosibacter sp.]|nr:hypothetical protein [Rugosibacter sp.]
SLVRVADMPLVLRVASLPDLALAPRGALVRLQVEAIDLLTAEMRLRFVEVLTMPVSPVAAMNLAEAAEADAAIDVDADAAADARPADMAEDIAEDIAD